LPVPFYNVLGAGIVAEAMRLVLADRLLKDSKLDPLSMLLYVAPPSCVLISIGFWFFEANSFPWERISSDFALVLILNGILSFGLNVCIVLLISHTSALTLTIGGIFKDLLLVFSSVFFFESPLTHLQIIGYSMSLGGMYVYKDFKTDPAGFTAKTYEALGAVQNFFFSRFLGKSPRKEPDVV
jgi:drug/metabolite transporter (DMT)-like permease